MPAARVRIPYGVLVFMRWTRGLGPGRWQTTPAGGNVLPVTSYSVPAISPDTRSALRHDGNEQAGRIRVGCSGAAGRE